MNRAGFDFGLPPLPPDPRVDVMTSSLNNCWSNDITTVICAGNNEGTSFYLDDKTPQNLGTTSNGLITVGGVTAAGVLWPQTIPSRGFGGSISIYAQAENVVVAGTSSNDASAVVPGTSVAAPAVVCCIYVPA